METLNENEGKNEEIIECEPLLSSPTGKSIKTKVPEVEIHLFRRGEGPVDVFPLKLVGWDQEQLDVREILEKYDFKRLYAFNQDLKRGAPIRFYPNNGMSLNSYSNGSVIYLDGEPKDSLINPITKILIGVAVITFFISLSLKETPGWIKKLSFKGVDVSPWILACIVIVFTRIKKRTRGLLKKFGW